MLKRFISSIRNRPQPSIELEADSPACLHGLFDQQAQRRGSSIALETRERRVTYRELQAEANGLAAHLRSLGVGRGRHVGICVERGVEMIVAMLGVLKAGAAYVPLDPNYPADRLQFMADDAQLAALLAQRGTSDKFRLGKTLCVTPTATGKWPSIDAAAPLVNEAADAAYLIYTSGSTGRPKGVVVEHRSVVNLVTTQQRSLPVGPEDRMLQMASSSFDVSVWEIFTALGSGAALCLATAAQLQPGPALGGTLRDMRITIAAFPASVLAALPHEELPHLKTLVVGGEKSSPELVALWSKGRQYINHYGPTEATVCATMHRCAVDGQSPPIGKPIDNVNVHVLDECGEPVEQGAVGEIYIGGAGLAREYWRRPELTAERFVKRAWNGAEPQRLYRTGDLARIGADGELDFVGRVDDQVKLRGFRIELGEIEAVLTEHAQVRQAAVIVREDAPGVRQLTAYVLGESTLDVEALQQHVAQQLPGHMTPAIIMQLDAMPLTPNGKLDRAQLPRPDAVRSNDDRRSAAGDTQLILVEIWCDVLGVSDVGVDEHFVVLGGDSLLSVEIAEQASAAGVPLTPEEILRHPTIAQLAAVVEQRGS